eukprot:131833_1
MKTEGNEQELQTLTTTNGTAQDLEAGAQAVSKAPLDSSPSASPTPPKVVQPKGRLTRQKSIELITAKRATIAICVPMILQLIFLSPAIAAIVIAASYDEASSPCGGTEYTRDLDTFLYIGGGIQLVYGTFALVARMCTIATGHDFSSLGRADGCEGLFLLVWAGIGLYMYDNEMSEECQEEPIGQMILAWSVIPFCMIGLYCCCVICAVACGVRPTS